MLHRSHVGKLRSHSGHIQEGKDPSRELVAVLATITVRLRPLLPCINASLADEGESAQAQKTATDCLWHEGTPKGF